MVGLLFGLHLGFAPAFGRELFTALHSTLFGAIWVLVPMLTADCISRERREGTLGLLFLTPLKGPDIVVAKGVAQGLRAMTLGLAVLPVLTIPFLLGGVSWTEASLSVILNANAMCWALAAGLLASAWSKAWLRALLLAAILAFAFLLLLSVAAGCFLLQTLSMWRPGQAHLDWDRTMETGLGLLTNATGQWAYVGRWRAFGPIGVGARTNNALVLACVGGRGVGSGGEDPPLLAGGAALRATGLVPADFLHAGAVACLLSPLDAPEIRAQSHRLAGAAHLEWAVGDLGVVGSDWSRSTAWL